MAWRMPMGASAFGASDGEKNARTCDESCLDQLNALNYAAFAGTPFAVDLQKLARRNAGWLRRNSQIFRLILDPMAINQVPIGYSAMLPLTLEGIGFYLQGALKDADIPSRLVVPAGKSAAAVILFAIYLRHEYSFGAGNRSRRYTVFFLDQVRRHLHDVLVDTSGHTFAPVYVQTEFPSLRRRLGSYGFRSTAKWSADGQEIFVLEYPFKNQLQLGGRSG